MTTLQIIDKLKDDFEAALPAKILAAGLLPFDKYIADIPDTPEDKQLAFYFDRKRNDNIQGRFNVIIQAQLNSVLLRDSWSYQDLIETEIKNYNPEDIGFSERESYSIDSYPIFENDSTIILYEISFTNDLDDCS